MGLAGDKSCSGRKDTLPFGQIGEHGHGLPVLAASVVVIMIVVSKLRRCVGRGFAVVSVGASRSCRSELRGRVGQGFAVVSVGASGSCGSGLRGRVGRALLSTRAPVVRSCRSELRGRVGRGFAVVSVGLCCRRAHPSLCRENGSDSEESGTSKSRRDGGCRRCEWFAVPLFFEKLFSRSSAAKIGDEKTQKRVVSDLP